MPKLVLATEKYGNANKKSKFSKILTISTAVISTSLMVTSYFIYDQLEAVHDVNKPIFISIVGFSVLGLAAIIWLLQRLDVWTKVKGIFKSKNDIEKFIDKSTKAYKTTKKLNLRKKLNQARRKISENIKELPIDELKESLKTKDGKEVVKAGKELVKRSSLKDAGSTIKDIVEGAKQIKEAVLVNSEGEVYLPHPLELLDSKVINEESLSNPIKKNESQGTKEKKDSEIEAAENWVPIRGPTKAPVGSIPMINANRIQQKSKNRIVFAIIALFLISGGILSVFWFFSA